MESFVLKVPILGPHLPFYERNAILGPDLP